MACRRPTFSLAITTRMGHWNGRRFRIWNWPRGPAWSWCGCGSKRGRATKAGRQRNDAPPGAPDPPAGDSTNYMALLTDRSAIRARLTADRAWSVYALGDLAPGLF